MVAAHPRRTRCKGCGLLPRRGHGKHAGGGGGSEEKWYKKARVPPPLNYDTPQPIKWIDEMPKTVTLPHGWPGPPVAPKKKPPPQVIKFLSRNGGPLSSISEGMDEDNVTGGGVCTMGCKTRKHRKGCGFWSSAASAAKKYITPANIKKALEIASKAGPILESIAPTKYKAKLRKANEVIGAVNDAAQHGLGVGVRAKRKRGGSAYTSEAELDRMRKGKPAGAPHRVEEEWNPSGATDSGYKKISGVWYQNSIAGLHPISGVPPGYGGTRMPALSMDWSKFVTKQKGGRAKKRVKRVGVNLVADLVKQGARATRKKRGGGAFDDEYDRVDPIDRALWNRQKRAGVSTGRSTLPNRGSY